jgi:hypothetical protein
VSFFIDGIAWRLAKLSLVIGAIAWREIRDRIHSGAHALTMRFIELCRLMGVLTTARVLSRQR